MNDAGEPWDQAISRPSEDSFVEESGGSSGGLGSMSQREQEQLFSTYAPRKVRKAMKERGRRVNKRRSKAMAQIEFASARHPAWVAGRLLLPSP